MKPGILIITPIYAPTLAALEGEYDVHRLWTAADARAFLAGVAQSVRGAVTTGLAGFDRACMEALPRLEIIACFGTPRGTIDLAAAKERGVIVTNTPDAIAEPVAELAMGLMLAVMRRICEADRFVRAGNWLQGPMAPGTGLRDKTCGIVGLGRIGREIAKLAEAVGMRVRYHGPRCKDDLAYPYHPDPVSLARASDCLVIACPASPQTRSMIDGRVLDALGPEGCLVNVARGAIVDEAALISALREKRIAGAGLDVYWDEPRVPAELVAMDNVVLVPHIGSTTREIREARGAKVLANLRAHFAGNPVPHPFG
jgi:lactate dehydrogenase-like 2-hydroxyacid dehydrogenase